MRKRQWLFFMVMSSIFVKGERPRREAFEESVPFV